MSKKVNVAILSAVMLSLLCLSVYAQVGVSGRSSSQRQRQAQPSTTATAAVAADANTFTDPRDGQRYRTVKIGGLTWMAQNLNHVTDNSWCYGNDASNCEKYGRLYDWNTAMVVCPTGWRLPTREDWGNLVEAAGGDVAGTKLKSESPDWNGTDDFGFSALPGGNRSPFGSFDNIGGNFGLWWSATEDEIGNVRYQYMYSGNEKMNENSANKDNGFSVRCVR